MPQIERHGTQHKQYWRRVSYDGIPMGDQPTLCFYRLLYVQRMLYLYGQRSHRNSVQLGADLRLSSTDELNRAFRKTSGQITKQQTHCRSPIYKAS